MFNNATQLIKRLILPSHFPSGVTPNYAPFVVWRMAYLTTSMACEVVASKLVLISTMEHSKAPLRWLMREGAAHAACIAYSYIVANDFGSHTGRYLMVGAMLVGISQFIYSISGKFTAGHHLGLTIVAAILKAVGHMNASATKANVFKLLSTNDDQIGELACKSVAQAKLCSSLGFFAGFAICVEFQGLWEFAAFAFLLLLSILFGGLSALQVEGVLGFLPVSAPIDETH